jgi:hypothetical protein
MTIDEPNLPFFLGVSRRAARRGYELDLLGVTRVILFPFLPQRLTGLQCLIGLNRSSLVTHGNYSYRWLLTDESQPTNQAWRNQDLSPVSREAGPAIPLERGGFAIPPTPSEGGPTNFGWDVVRMRDQAGSIEILPMPAPPLMVWRPCSVLVDVELNGKRYRRGEFICGIIPPPPLTDEERRAIASRPGATKSVKFHIGCKVCGSEAYYYSQLNPSDARPADLPTGAAPLHEAPTTWACRCGQTSIDLSYLKQGLHDVFRYPRPRLAEDPVMHFTPLYEAGRIQDIIAEFEQLLTRSLATKVRTAPRQTAMGEPFTS